MSYYEDALRIIRSVGDRKVLREDEAKNILKSYEIPTTDFHLIRGPEDLDKVEISFPAVLKLCSERYMHKTDVGGVKLDIRDIAELRSELEEMRKRFPNEHYLVEAMERGGLELIMGLSRDETFGLAIMVGMGGIFTELYKDVSFRVVPIDEYDAREMLDDLKASEIFKGFRGIKADLESTLDILFKLSRLGSDLRKEIDQMDLNPVLVREKDAVVVDTKLVLKRDESLPA